MTPLRRGTLVSGLWLVAAGATAWADAPFDSTAALARARQLRAAVSQGDAATLWAAFTERMRTAMGDSVAFVAKNRSMSTAMGTIDSVLSEEVRVDKERVRVTSRCRFANPPVPLALTMAFTAEGRLDGLVVRPDTPPTEAPSAYLDYQAKTPLRLPFRGEWLVYWGGRTLETNHHAASRSQRFAHDLIIVRDGKTHRGDGKRLEDYYSYGEPVLAPAAGTVVWVQDSLPDQAPGSTDPEHPVGNGMVIDHGNGEFSLFAHLSPGTLRVKAGERVKPGQELGRCGNSGNTSEPHLHYHLQNGPTMAEADGLPARFHELMVDGKPADRVELLKGQRVRPAK